MLMMVGTILQLQMFFEKCSVCGATWKGDVISAVTMKKCTH